MKPYKVVDHTADWAIQVQGKDLADLFANAALGMGELLAGELTAVPETVVRTMALEQFDVETLLVEWLTELAYWAESEQLVFHKFEMTAVTQTHLNATLFGGRVDELQKHIKAVTYHNLAIKETAAGLETTIVFDV